MHGFSRGWQTGLRRYVAGSALAPVVLFAILTLWPATPGHSATTRPSAATRPLATMPTPTPKPPAPAKPIQLGASCVTAECHSDLLKRQFLHGPMNLKTCEPCHVPINGQHTFDQKTPTRDLCLKCHETEAPQKVVHVPFAKDCSACHDPHGGDNRYFVKGGLNAEGCDRCHSDIRKGLSRLHGPVAEGQCLACHSPHQSAYPNLLVDAPGQLCVSCHVDFPATMSGAISTHKPATDNCQGCHNPHGGSTQFFVEAQGRELCQRCHGDFLKKWENFKYTHITMAEGKSCENCHAPHSSSHEYLLRQNDEQLCLGCHDKTIQTAQGATLPNIADQLKNAKDLHGPLRQNNCSACHAAHGSDFINILDKAFPPGFYAPYVEGAYDLCFQCHDRSIVLAKTSTTDNFRNGDLSLHYLHVNREKGRTCRACHAEHASNQPDHIRDEVPFGRWMMTVTFSKTDTGARAPLDATVRIVYDRVNPVDNHVPPGQ